MTCVSSLSIVAFLIMVSFAEAATLTVDLNGGADYTDIQSAIDAAAGGDTVLVKPGEYVITEPITFKGKAITVRGEGGAEVTTIRMSESPLNPDLASVVRFVSHETPSSILEGFTLTGGKRASFSGCAGGIMCVHSSPTVANCTISANSGPGVASSLGSPALTNCTISGNSGDYGVGVYCDDGATLTNCTISGNEGGGVHCPGGSPALTNCTISGNRGFGVALTDSTTLTNCTISRNHGRGVECTGGTLMDCTIAENTAGGVWCYDGSPTLTNCTISGNTSSGAGSGGGVYCGGSSPTLTNCTIAGNVAKTGGGVCTATGSASSPRLINCTIVWNLASGEGGGVYCSHNCSTTLTSCIVWGSVGSAISKEDDSSNVTVSYSCIEGASVWPGAGNVNEDPRLCGWPRAELYVDASGPGPGTGTQADPYTTLTSALRTYNFGLASDSPCRGIGEGGADMGAPGGTCDAAGHGPCMVHLAAGTYTLDGVTLVQHVSVQGAGQELTVIEGTVYGLRTGAVLSGVTVTKGMEGGIVLGAGEAPEIRDCTIVGNSGILGGGISCLGGSPTLTNCTITQNRVQLGGNNPAGEGGGVYCLGGSPTLANCTIARNWASGTGGGLACAGGSPTLANCTITGNTATQSPPVWQGDNGDGDGGGILCAGGSPTLTNCTIVGNLASGEGGGVYCLGGSPTLTSCIVWGNGGSAISKEDDSSNVTVSYSCIEDAAVWPGVGNTNEDPRLCGWPDVELYADGSALEPGTGTQADPYTTLSSALMAYRLSLASDSPCRGTGEGGADMGAPQWTCEAAGYGRCVVHLAGGTYTLDGLTLVQHVSIEGAGEEVTVIEGTVYGLRTGAVLSGLTVTKGTEGGIVVRAGEAPEIRDCTITGNTAASFHGGGGVSCSGDSSPTLANCTITDNKVALTSTWFMKGYGGGVLCAGGSPTLTNCRITGNTAIQGGGVCCLGGSPTLTNCTIAGNWASIMGGGVCCGGGSPTMTNCTITGNLTHEGGGVYCNSSSPTLTNCTIAGNTADSPWGGGVCCWDSSSTLGNCIVWGNMGGTLAGAEINALYSCLEGDPLWPGEGNINSDPLFVRPGRWEDCADAGQPGCIAYPWSPDNQEPTVWHRWVEGDYHLQAGSPCIDAGTSGGAPAEDIEGNVRPSCGAVDIGAYEFVDCAELVRFLRGDSNASNAMDIADAVFTLSYLFAKGKVPDCLDAADANDSGAVDIADAIRTLSHLFAHSGDLPPPFGECGIDPTDDTLGCLSYPHCEGQ